MSQPIRSSGSPTPTQIFNLADPLTFPLEFKAWLVQYLTQELLVSQLTGYKVGGATGPKGDPGPVGPPGPSGTGGDLTYVHSQVSPAPNWTVVHNLGKFPAVDVVDSGNNVLIPDVHYVDANTVGLAFASATSGKAYVN